VCPSPEDVFPGDQSITVDLTLAVPGSCAMLWFRYGGVRGYQLMACADRVEMAKVGDAVVSSIGASSSTVLQPGTRHKLSVTIAGPHATVAIDGATAIRAAVADPGLASGRVVLGVTGTQAAGSAEVRFADLDVRAS
jgi:hypothetical protein